ncbi:hypothetical protein Tco_0658066 [Tanacetum coccineum]
MTWLQIPNKVQSKKKQRSSWQRQSKTSKSLSSKTVQAKVLTEMKKQLPTHVPTAIAKFVKPRLNNTVLEVMKNNQINLYTTPSLTTTDDLSEIDLKLKLLNKMYKSKSFESHDTHHKLYNVLYESMCLDQETLDA